ncbi:UV-stimulated scaffold protein A isoform X6 [Desmodus rotundus]|uniref:UV-stimulated scaffold protein A isoform X6 n=1 Tax=Desmodus rotundus TaxID=9430 RepID=UPI00238159DF|nr:UV-stimulated scaffold protein A isoform X6 [Desmodus rotundus]
MDQRLSELVEDLTTSGEPQLNPEKMKELKKICKSSEEQLSRAYHLLMAQLSREHAEVRLSAFQIVGELFGRSHLFRMLVVSNFQEFLELTLGTDHRKPLPPPREVAQRLKQAVTLAVQGWNEKFGAAYKKLALGYHFLKHSQQVDFQDVNARTPVERKREEEKQRRLDRIYRERSEQAVREMQEMSEEIRGCLVEVDSCFRLLLPFDLGPFLGAAPPTTACAVSEGGALCPAGTPDLGDEEQPCCSKTLPACARLPGATSGEELCQASTGALSEEEEEEDSDQEEFVRHHGLGSHKYTLDVELCSDGLRVQADEDNCAVIQSAQDALKLIRNKFLPAVCTWVQLFTRAGTHHGHLEAAIDLKTELEAALRRSRELDIEPVGLREREVAAPGDEDEDEDDFVEVPEKEGYEACVPDHLWPKDEPSHSTASGSPVRWTRRWPAPRSLRGCGVAASPLRGSSSPCGTGAVPPSPTASSCPFHGKIIPRDDTGQPICPDDRAREQRQQLQRQTQHPDWQDPELMRDVEVAVGVDLGSSRAGGRGRGKRRRHPGLTNLKRQASTARTRIAKKVFAKAAMRRVSTALDQMDQKKHRKFANQFNYALS